MAQPKEALVGANQSININSQAKASPANQIIGNNDTVTFNNNDPSNSATVAFLGAGSNEFSQNGTTVTTVTIPAGTSSAALSPNVQNVTINYSVTIGDTTNESFAIEVGTGALEIDIVNSSGSTNLGAAGIPNNGTLFFKNTVGYQATVTFSKANVMYDPNGNSVTSQTIGANSSGQVLTGKGTNQDVRYGVRLATEPGGLVGDGSGSIKIGSN